MATLAEIRGRLRRMLEDTDPAAPVWSDAELGEWLATAARTYGLRRPREATTTIAPVAGQTDYPLPEGARRVVAVESPAGYPLPRRPPRVAHEAGAAQSWAHFGGAVLCGLPPTAPLTVRYRGLYPWPTADGAAVELPDEGLDLVVLGATVLALSRREIAAGKRRGGAAGVAQALAVARAMEREAWGRLGRSVGSR